MKKLLFTLISTTLLLSTIVNAATFGDYEYTDNGDGSCVINEYTGSATSVDIPETINGLTVTALGGLSFASCTLTNLTIPDSVTTIGNYCFIGCGSLTSLTIPESVTEIGIEFAQDTGLEVLIFEGNSPNVNFDNYLPRDCDILFTYGKPAFTTPEWQGYSCRPTPESAFSFTDNLDGTCSIDDYVDYKLDGQRLVIPETLAGLTVTSLSEYSFQNCTNITYVTMLENINSLGSDCFDGCTYLERITIPNSVTLVGINCFKNCSSLTSITLSDSLAFLSGGMFQGCTSLTTITIPDSVTSLGRFTFLDCTSLNSLIIPEFTTFVGLNCFDGCTSLESLTIPETVTKIEEYLAIDSAITNLLFQGNAPIIDLTNALPSECKIYYMQGKTGFATPTWQGYACAPLPEPAICGLLSLVFIFLFKRNYK